MPSMEAVMAFLEDLGKYTALTVVGTAVMLGGLRLFGPSLDPMSKEKEQATQQRSAIFRRLGVSVPTNRYEDVVATYLVDPNEIDVGFRDVGGLDSVKAELLQSVLLPLTRPDLFQRGRLLSPPKGVLLYGPPGCGKTMLAKAIAKEAGASFLNLHVSQLFEKYVGETEKLLHAVFTLAAKLAPCIIFIDEIDGALRTRDSGSSHPVYNNLKNDFMAYWDGLNSSQGMGIMVIGATNRPSDIDPAVLRRLSASFYVGLPDCNQRISILERLLDGEDTSQLDIARLAALTEGFSGSDLQELCKRAAMEPLRELLYSDGDGRQRHDVDNGLDGLHAVQSSAASLRAMQLGDFQQALQRVRGTGQRLDQYRQYQSDPAQFVRSVRRQARRTTDSPATPVSASSSTGSECGSVDAGTPADPELEDDRLARSSADVGFASQGAAAVSPADLLNSLLGSADVSADQSQAMLALLSALLLASQRASGADPAQGLSPGL